MRRINYHWGKLNHRHLPAEWTLVLLVAALLASKASANPCPCDTARPNGVTIENIRVFPSDRDQVEPSIAAYGRGGGLLMIGANSVVRDSCRQDLYDLRQASYLGVDSGSNWRGFDTVPQSLPGAINPTVAFGSGGVGYDYYCCGYLQSTSDTGANWSAPQELTPGIRDDRPFIVIDRNERSPFYGNIYVAYTNLDSGTVDLRQSTNGGMDFDSAVSILPGGIGVDLAVDDDGTVYAVVDNSGAGMGGCTRMWFCKSTNGGVFFTEPTQISDASFIGLRHAIKSWAIKASGHPTIAVDTSRGPFDGRLYVAWADVRNGWTEDDTHFRLDPDIYLSWSDEGVNWSTPVRVNDDSLYNRRDQWFPRVEVDPYGGVNIIFYDSRNDPNDRYTETFLARSVDGGQTFFNFPVSTVSFVPCTLYPWDSHWERGDYWIPGQPFAWFADFGYIGDYIGITSDSNFIYPCWPDNRIRHPLVPDELGIYQIFVARVPLVLSGHLVRDTTLSGIVVLSGDVTVDSGVTLTIKPHAKIVAKSFQDDRASGENPYLTELIVKGHLVIDTGDGRPSFVANQDTVGAWCGIRVKRGGSASWGNGCRILNAQGGVSVAAGATPMDVRGVTVVKPEYAGLTSDSDGVRFVHDTVIDVTTGYGIFTEESDAPVDSCFIQNCEYGIYAFRSSATVRGCEVKGPGVIGITVNQTGEIDAGIDTLHVIDTKVTGYFTGAHLSAGWKGHCRLDSCLFQSDLGDGRSHNGVSAGQDASVRMRDSKILGYDFTGFYSYKSAAYLGDCKAEPGHNQIYTTIDTCGEDCLTLTKSVRHTGKTSTDTLKAEMNWWDSVPPPSQWFLGRVDYTPWLTSPPLGKVVPRRVNEPTAVPAEFVLGQNYPNPFNPSTAIEFALPSASKVQVTVYNILGQVVTTLADREFPAGRHQLIWDGTNERGRPVSSGIYFYRVVSDEGVESKKMVLLK